MNSSALQLTWEPPAPEQRNGIIRGYLINATAWESGEYYEWMSDTMSLVISSLHPHYHYNLSVAANTIGLGPFSDNYTVLMPQDGKYNLHK